MNDDFTRYKKYSFNFTSSGFFTLMNRKGEPLYEQALPYFKKVVSHLIWIVFWLAAILFSACWGAMYLLYVQRLSMTLIFLHFFLLGCRLTSLFLVGGIRPIFFPPLWIRLTRKMQKKPDIVVLKAHHLENHPGLLANLALIFCSRNQRSEAQSSITTALNAAPTNITLQQLHRAISNWR